MKAALLVIDFTNDIAHPNGKIARSAERIQTNKTIQKANQAIAHARSQSWLLIFVKVGFHENYLECPLSSPLFGQAPKHKALLLNSWGTEFLAGLDLQSQDTILVKHRVSCFYATSLESILRAQGIDTLFLAGTGTNMTIEHTARDAHDRDYSVYIITDACEAASEEEHKSALKSLERLAALTTCDTLPS